MMNVHILSDGFVAPNARAFVFPLIVHRRALRQAGIEIKLFDRPVPELTAGDVLLVDGRYFTGPEKGRPEYLVRCLEGWRGKQDNLAWVDTSDSAGWLHAEALPLVRHYFKGQFLKDRDLYTKPLYGRRLYSDYYHRVEGVVDGDAVTGELSEPQVRDPKLLDRLFLSYNSAYCDYSRFSPWFAEGYRHLGWPALLRFPCGKSVPPSIQRPFGISCRISINYPRSSVAWQRRRVAEMLSAHLPVNRVGRGRFFAEMAKAKAVISPFGWGEINIGRDYECFLSGALLIKPDMSHLETWPNVFIAGSTMVIFRWDMSDLVALVEEVECHYEKFVEIARRGQEAYYEILCGEQAAAFFVDRFAGMIRSLLNS